MIKIITAIGILASTATLAQAAYFDATPINRCDTQITVYLQAGYENNQVYILQSLLNQGGYMHVAANGYFGPSTLAALKRFQIDILET